MGKKKEDNSHRARTDRKNLAEVELVIADDNGQSPNGPKPAADRQVIQDILGASEPPKAPKGGFVEVAEGELRALQEKAGERDPLRDKYLRAKADFINLQNRIERERQVWSETAVRGFFMKLVPVLDDLDRAMNSPVAGPDAQSLAQGFRLVVDSLYRALAQCGIEPIQAQGQRFDPALHEALFQEETDEHPDQTVLEELQRGFTLNGQVIRPAKVKVSRARQK